MAGIRILLPCSEVSVVLSHLTLGNPLASSHHGLRKIRQDISYTREQETQDTFFINLLSLHGCISTRPLNIACEYWPVQNESAISNIPFQWILNLSSGKTVWYQGKIHILSFSLPFLCSNPLLAYASIAYLDRKAWWGGLSLGTII